MNDLKGHFFHSFNKDGLVEWQGKVISNPEPGIYLVQLYEWFVGAESCRKLVNIQDMIQWSFYETNEEMNNYYYSKDAMLDIVSNGKEHKHGYKE